MHPADASNPRICLISGLVLIACTCCTGHSRWAHGQTLIILKTHGESHHLGVTEPSVAVGVNKLECSLQCSWVVSRRYTDGAGMPGAAHPLTKIYLPWWEARHLPVALRQSHHPPGENIR